MSQEPKTEELTPNLEELSPPPKKVLPSLQEVIAQTTTKPTIVNKESKFVVVTYWWGRDNLNSNTARPCISYYEDLFKRVEKICVDTLLTINQMSSKPEKSVLDGQLEDMKADLEVQLENITKISPLYNLLKKKTEDYYNEIYLYLDFPINSRERCLKLETTASLLEGLKKSKKTPEGYIYKTRDDIYMLLLFITTEFIRLNKADIIRLYEIKMEVADIKTQYLNREKSTAPLPQSSLNGSADEAIQPKIGGNDLELGVYKKKLDVLINEKTEVSKRIKLSPKTNNVYTIIEVKPNAHEEKTKEVLLSILRSRKDFQNKSLNEILVQEMRYLNPLRYQDMLDNWNTKCHNTNCNYMSVEYPRFAEKEGGYQMAINAKPLFIQKALELCHPLSVLYIDGDMTIRKYPSIFDLPEIDYMARGWHMDPRSSYKLDESITYDPYIFETSGGTMFFSNSEESRELLKLWISTSDSCYQVGKADDRIISLIVNSRKLLLKMKIVQLPIEYLWLTLDYSERLIESEFYDYNSKKMESSIFIDHPECLTSEDTATSSGSCSDRTPKFYGFIEENVDPVSEEFFEYLAFPEKKYVEGLQTYNDFMREIYYLDDGNKILYEKGFVEPGRDVAFNEQPLYITDFDKKFGSKRNELSEAIIERATSPSMAKEGLYTYDDANKFAVITNGTFTKGPEEDNRPDTIKIIVLIYKLLSEGKDVLYNPKPGEDGGDAIYKEFITNRETKYKNTEFAFVPVFNQSSKYNDIYRPKIDLTDCMYFKSGCDFMKKFITMFESLEDMSNYINNGFYQLMSSVRVSYFVIRKQSTKKVVPQFEEPPSIGLQKGGGCTPNIDFAEEYLKAMEAPKYDTSDLIQKAAGKKYIKRSRKRVRFSNKRSRKQRK